MENDSYNILYSITDFFVPQAAACICSVCENNTSAAGISFYIFGLNISDENKQHLSSLINRYAVNEADRKAVRTLTIIDLDQIDHYFDFELAASGWNQISLARLLMARLLPANVDRLIYLDGDTIVRGDLSDLWNFNLGGKTLGMCCEPTTSLKRRQSLGLTEYYYHNAGVLLVDLKRWREINAEKIIMDYYKAHEGKLYAIDQDAINASLKDEIAEIPPKYNFSNIFTTYPWHFLKKLVAPKPYISREVFDDSVKKPVIIHYLGEERPWRRGNTHPYRMDYEHYLSLTPWANTPCEEGWQTYFFCWRIFNFLMKPFPSLRYRIMDRLIPLFLKYRSRKKS